MEIVKIYLAGAMSGLTLKEQLEWRKEFISLVQKSYGYINPRKIARFFNPPEYYNYENKLHKSEREVFEFDLYNLRQSDIVVVNFNNPNSIGTAMELMYAKQLGKPVVGISTGSGNNLHPWLIECTTRMCTSLKEATQYVEDFFIN